MSDWPIVIPAHLVDGLLHLNRTRLQKLLRGRKDSELEIIIERKHATRSVAQNAAYWGLYLAVLSEHTGYTKDELHEYLKSRFLPKKLAIADAHGEITDEFTVGTTTTKLNKIEFGEYMESIARWAAEDLGVVIPSIRSAVA